MQKEQEFILLLNQHQNILYKVCNLYLNERHDREDLFQEITLQAWKAFDGFRGDSKFSTWLYRVALNTAITFFKKEKKKSAVLLPGTFTEPIQFYEPLEEQVQAMYKAIAQLSKIDKALIMLYIEDYNYTDIGEMLGITANNVAVKISRIKIKLKEEITKHYQYS